MVEDLDFQELTSPNEVTGDLDVSFRWSWIATRMIMRDYNCCGTRHNRKPEDLTGMAKNCIQRPNGHQVMTLDASTSVEDQNNQTFTFRIEVRMVRDMRPPIGGCLVWSFAPL